MRNILGLIVLPFALMIVAIGLILLQIKCLKECEFEDDAEIPTHDVCMPIISKINEVLKDAE